MLFLLGRGRRIYPFIGQCPKFLSELAVVLTGVATRACGYLGGEQVGNQPVFVRGPHGAVTPQETRPRTFLAAKTDRAIEESLDEPLESDRNLDEPPAQMCSHAIDHAAADDRLADRDSR